MVDKDNAFINARTEYSAIASYTNHIVNIRFIIVGFFSSGSAFLAFVIFGKESMLWQKVSCISLALIYAVTCWILEVRNRVLLRNLAERGMQIEHDIFEYNGKMWYEGFYSRQNSIIAEPKFVGDLKAAPPIKFTALVLGIRLSENMAMRISHSLAFDILYLSAIIFWLFTLLMFLIN